MSRGWPGYRQRLLVSRAYEAKRLRLLAKYVVGPMVLDIGYAYRPNEHLRKFHTVGLDTEAPRQPSGYAEEIQGDGTDLASCLGERQFNTVVCGEIIEHVEDPYGFLRGVRRHVGPGGRLILTTPNPLGFPQLFFELFGIERCYYMQDHRFAFLCRWVKRMLTVTGFRVLRARGVGLQLYWFVPPCPRWLSLRLIYVAEPVGR
jgi:SAM-dependent methyltransferase